MILCVNTHGGDRIMCIFPWQTYHSKMKISYTLLLHDFLNPPQLNTVSILPTSSKDQQLCIHPTRLCFNNSTVSYWSITILTTLALESLHRLGLGCFPV